VRHTARPKGAERWEFALLKRSFCDHKPGGGQSGLGRIETSTLAQSVYNELRWALTGGVFVPGQAVSLRMLADQLGTSVMPVRQAINHLITEGGLAMMPNRTVIVPRMTRARFVELNRIRELLESEAGARACGNLTQGQREQLVNTNLELQQCLERGEIKGALAANRDFHFRLYEASAMPTLVQMIGALWLQIGPFLHLSISDPLMPWDGGRHDEVLAALAARDAQAARRAIEQDVVLTARAFLAADRHFDQS